MAGLHFPLKSNTEGKIMGLQRKIAKCLNFVTVCLTAEFGEDPLDLEARRGWVWFSTSVAALSRK